MIYSIHDKIRTAYRTARDENKGFTVRVYDKDFVSVLKVFENRLTTVGLVVFLAVKPRLLFSVTDNHCIGHGWSLIPPRITPSHDRIEAALKLQFNSFIYSEL